MTFPLNGAKIGLPSAAAISSPLWRFLGFPLINLLTPYSLLIIPSKGIIISLEVFFFKLKTFFADML